jgi:hypothetical protein
VVAAKEAAPTQRRIPMARLTWTTLPRRKLYGEFGLVNLVALIPSIATQRRDDTQLTWPESDLAAPTDAIYQPQHPILY